MDEKAERSETKSDEGAAQEIVFGESEAVNEPATWHTVTAAPDAGQAAILLATWFTVTGAKARRLQPRLAASSHGSLPLLPATCFTVAGSGAWSEPSYLHPRRPRAARRCSSESAARPHPGRP